MRVSPQITHWDRNFIGFQFRVKNPEHIKRRLQVVGFSPLKSNVLRRFHDDTVCIFKEENVVSVTTHKDNLSMVYHLISG